MSAVVTVSIRGLVDRPLPNHLVRRLPDFFFLEVWSAVAAVASLMTEVGQGVPINKFALKFCVQIKSHHEIYAAIPSHSTWLQHRHCNVPACLCKENVVSWHKLI